MDFPNLRAEFLTKVITGIQVSSDYPFQGMFGGLTYDYDGEIASWDEVTPNRERDNTAETATSMATATDGIGSQKKSASMFTFFKKRYVFPEALDGLRAVGSGSADFDRSLTNLTLAIGDMRRLHYDAPWEYMISQALQNTLSFSVKGVTVSPDFGLPSSHNLAENTSWATPSTDIDAKVETVKRILATDAGRSPVTAICGRNIFGYLRKNNAVGKWFTNQNGARETYGALQQDVIENLFGIRWVTMRHGDFVNGTFTPYVPDDTVIFIPTPDRSWFQVHRGSVRYPNTLYGAPTEFTKSYGLTSWSRLKDEPPAACVYMRWKGLAIPVFPSAYLVLSVIPE